LLSHTPSVPSLGPGSPTRIRFRLATQSLIRLFVCLHALALFALPKDSWGLTSYRPEDVTGVMLLVLFGVLAASDSLPLPSRRLATIVTLYASYFLLVLVLHDLPRGYVETVVFLAKELSYVAFGYLVWRAYRTAPGDFVAVVVLLSLPNIVFGVSQLFGTPLGLYGIAPFGHWSSPASAGLMYFAYAVVLFIWREQGRHGKLSSLLCGVAVVLIFAAGSKIAVVGVISFFGWYWLLTAVQRPTLRSFATIGVFAATSVVMLALAWVAGSQGYASSGLGRYQGFLTPWDVLRNRGIWWKLDWMNDPVSIFVGAGYSAGHLTPDQVVSYGMAMDNQALYYLVTGGTVGLVFYVILMAALYRVTRPTTFEGRTLRALVVSYCLMGAGAEVLQLSLHGNVFWMMVALCLAMSPRATPALASTVVETAAGVAPNRLVSAT
jgi:hypothetical protein